MSETTLVLKRTLLIWNYFLHINNCYCIFTLGSNLTISTMEGLENQWTFSKSNFLLSLIAYGATSDQPPVLHDCSIWSLLLSTTSRKCWLGVPFCHTSLFSKVPSNDILAKCARKGNFHQDTEESVFNTWNKWVWCVGMCSQETQQN